METKKENYNKYVVKQRMVVINLETAIDNFEHLADLPIYSNIESELIAMKKKLKEIETDINNYVREFDEEEEW